MLGCHCIRLEPGINSCRALEHTLYYTMKWLTAKGGGVLMKAKTPPVNTFLSSLAADPRPPPVLLHRQHDLWLTARARGSNLYPTCATPFITLSTLKRRKTSLPERKLR